MCFKQCKMLCTCSCLGGAQSTVSLLVPGSCCHADLWCDLLAFVGKGNRVVSASQQCLLCHQGHCSGLDTVGSWMKVVQLLAGLLHVLPSLMGV